ncbi:MAG: HAMP domain-containing histidine kinase [Lachnospiraceae bacterium]|nr:HAMP domain-containing histidine kinase [Lachnospiraceae bacterium]
MKKKQVMSRGKRSFWLILHRIFTAAAVMIIVALSFNSTITVETNGKIYRQNITLESGDSFEDSSLFNDILREELQGIIRMAVIKSQLETEGSYNGMKEVDIARFAHRQEDFTEDTPTAKYYLDDLVKWGNYGFVTEKVYATQEELNSYFKDGYSVFSLQNELLGEEWSWSGAEEMSAAVTAILDEKSEKTLSMRMIEELPNSKEEYLRMAEQLGKYVDESEILELNVLVPRYLSVDGCDLAQYAFDVDEYVRLREDLKTTSKELFYNFTEYSENKSFYAADASNIRFCYRMVVDGEVCYFSNIEEDFDSKKLDEITRQFENYGKYVYYIADRAEMNTNTRLNSDIMKQEMGYYQYAFGDNTRAWIAVDTGYPAKDSFFAAKVAYDSLMPYYLYLACAMVLFTILSVFLYIHLTRYEGRIWADNEEGYRIELHKADKIYTEPFTLLCVIAVGGIAGGGYLGYRFLEGVWDRELIADWFPAIAGIFALLLDYVFMFFYLSLVRRGKAHTLWKNSLIREILIRIRKGVLALYDNGHILIRSLLPAIILLVLNLILGGCGIIGILIAAFVDVAAILFIYLEKKGLQEIVEITERIGKGDFDLKVSSEKMHGENRELADAVNGIGKGIKTAVEQSMKDERLKADLITNVSHDIKTPLTSIINFVNLLKREKIEDERIQGYINVLDAKSQRLKTLTDDLVEASKITSGNITLQMERINFAELVNQTCGEFDDKFREKCLEMVVGMPEKPLYIEADSRRIWRVVDNLFSNVWKYALEGTRVYMDMKELVRDGQKYAIFSMKNISAQALNIEADELTERFIRGDISRSTEGSGLGLSIAKNLTELQNGKFEIYLDGDLFKVILTFPVYKENA